MRSIRSFVVSTALVGAAGTVALPAGPATGQEGSIQIAFGRTASLSDRGQTLTLPVTVTCTLPSGFQVGIQETLFFVSQKRGQDTIQGQGGGGLVCDGQAHTLSYVAHALAGARDQERFHGGKAMASLFILVCDTGGSVCVQGDSGQRSIKVAG